MNEENALRQENIRLKNLLGMWLYNHAMTLDEFDDLIRDTRDVVEAYVSEGDDDIHRLNGMQER
jgi:hypothetical protein